MHLQIYTIDTADYRAVLLNMKQTLWQDLNVRQAFSYAVDRKQIVDGILKEFGTEAYSPLQKHSFSKEDIEKYEFNLDKANNLLDKAGWVTENDGFRYKNGEKLAFAITAPI